MTAWYCIATVVTPDAKSGWLVAAQLWDLPGLTAGRPWGRAQIQLLRNPDDIQSWTRLDKETIHAWQMLGCGRGAKVTQIVDVSSPVGTHLVDELWRSPMSRSLHELAIVDVGGQPYDALRTKRATAVSRGELVGAIASEFRKKNTLTTLPPPKGHAVEKTYKTLMTQIDQLSPVKQTLEKNAEDGDKKFVDETGAIAFGLIAWYCSDLWTRKRDKTRTA